MDVNGKIIKTYDSIRNAEKAMACSESWLSEACGNKKIRR